jgi:hypothetical protein
MTSSSSSFGWFAGRRSARGPAATFLLVVGVASGAVYYSHYQQVRDKTVMKEGVARDKERVSRIRKERRLEQQQQQQARAEQPR